MKQQNLLNTAGIHRHVLLHDSQILLAIYLCNKTQLLSNADNQNCND